MNAYLVAGLVAVITGMMYALLLKVKKHTNDYALQNGFLVAAVTFAASLGVHKLANDTEATLQTPFLQPASHSE